MPIRAALACLVLLLLGAAPARAGEDLLTNGDFARRGQDGVPVGWTARQGARSRDVGASTRLGAPDGGGVLLEGGPQTARWTMLGQSFRARPGETFLLTFTARAVGLALDRGQFGSCYVGFVLRDGGGRVRSFHVRDVRAADWRGERLLLRLPARDLRPEVALFLSQTGRLEVRRVALRRVTPQESYDVLVDDMARYYSFLGPHHVPWARLVAAHAEAARAARDPQAFVAAIRPLLAALRDPHVWVDAPGQARIVPWNQVPKPNFDVAQVLKRLRSYRQVIRNVIAGRTREGYGYLALGTMQGSDAQRAAVESAWQGLFDAPAIVLDLRVDSGGQETWGQRLCGCLTRTPVVYARQLRRSGPRPGDLAPAGTRRLMPRVDAAYRGPVVALVGPGCISSGEGMAMMLKALPDVPLVGLPTRGASGNPEAVPLPNGVDVWYSRWVSLLPDGTSIERHGVPPDVVVRPAAGRDTAFDKAVALLAARLAAPRKDR
jgi:hypothetical protein